MTKVEHVNGDSTVLTNEVRNAHITFLAEREACPFSRDESYILQFYGPTEDNMLSRKKLQGICKNKKNPAHSQEIKQSVEQNSVIYSNMKPSPICIYKYAF